MGMQQKQAYCNTCKQLRLFQRAGTNHVLHLLITVVLFSVSSFVFGILGFAWLFIWFLCAVSKGPYRCTQCGEAAQESHVIGCMLLVLFVFGGIALFIESKDLLKERSAENEERNSVVIQTNSVDPEAELNNDIAAQKIKEYQEFLEGCSNEIKEMANTILLIREFAYESEEDSNDYAGSEQEAIDKAKIIEDVENGIILGTETEIQNLKRELSVLIEQRISDYKELRDACADEIKEEMDLTLRIKEIEYERVNGLGTYTNSPSSVADMTDLIKSAKGNELSGSEEIIESLENRLKELKEE